jgi:hypothetical protein
MSYRRRMRVSGALVGAVIAYGSLRMPPVAPVIEKPPRIATPVPDASPPAITSLDALPVIEKIQVAPFSDASTRSTVRRSRSRFDSRSRASHAEVDRAHAFTSVRKLAAAHATYVLVKSVVRISAETRHYGDQARVIMRVHIWYGAGF